MSAYDPPSESIDVFNSSLFTSTSENITQSYADTHYLKYPTSQTGTETIYSLATTNDATINGLTVGKGAGSVATNTALGDNALAVMTSSGNNNVAIGTDALVKATSSIKNTAVGSNALTNTITGSKNTAVGNSSLSGNFTGEENTAVGDGALFATTASNNTAVGFEALSINTSGSNNTAIGYRAGKAGTANLTGSNNTFIGKDAQANANNYSNSTALGSGATITASNQVVLGTTSDTVRYNKLAPLYTSVPTYTSSEVGYIFSSDGTGAFGTGSVDFITVTDLAVGVYIVKIDMTFSSPGSTTGSTFATLSIKKNSTVVSLATKGFAGLSTNAFVDAPVSLSAFLTSNGTDDIIVNRNLSTGMNGVWYFSYIRVA